MNTPDTSAVAQINELLRRVVSQSLGPLPLKNFDSLFERPDLYLLVHIRDDREQCQERQPHLPFLRSLT
jgi:hypothetical protein